MYALREKNELIVAPETIKVKALEEDFYADAGARKM